MSLTKTSKGYTKIPLISLWVKGSRCPWHTISGQTGSRTWGWGLSKDTGWGRFGGGWKWKLGIIKGGTTTIVEWVWGSFRFESNPAAVEKKE